MPPLRGGAVGDLGVRSAWLDHDALESPQSLRFIQLRGDSDCMDVFSCLEKDTGTLALQDQLSGIYYGTCKSAHSDP